MDPVQVVLVSAVVGATASLLTEGLRAKISGELWAAQERWKLKGQLYRETVETLVQVLVLLTRRASGQEIDLREPIGKLWLLRETGALWLDASATKVLDDMVTFASDESLAFSANDTPDQAKEKAARQQMLHGLAMRAITECAAKDLRFRP